MNIAENDGLVEGLSQALLDAVYEWQEDQLGGTEDEINAQLKALLPKVFVLVMEAQP
jgi:hypothetical protein